MDLLRYAENILKEKNLEITEESLKIVINNLKNESISSLIDTINNAVLTKKDDLVLPGLGVTLELFWESLNKEEKEKIASIILEKINK